MSKRSSALAENEKGEVVVVPGAWSGFEFDFSRAPIFYPLSNLTIEKGNFPSSKLYAGASFRSTRFINDADFSEATFISHADFSGTEFTSDANFIGTTFTSNAYFGESTFTNNANFTEAVFIGAAYFSEATFTQNARFSETAFAQVAHFSRATFEGLAGFRNATFEAGAEFYGASFVQTADFCDSSFVKSPPLFVAEGADSGEMRRARFAALSAGQEAHNFTVYEDSQPIPLGTAGLNGVGYRIPVGTVLFDPSSWDERQKEYTSLSEPAQ